MRLLTLPSTRPEVGSIALVEEQLGVYNGDSWVERLQKPPSSFFIKYLVNAAFVMRLPIGHTKGTPTNGDSETPAHILEFTRESYRFRQRMQRGAEETDLE